MPQSEKVAAFIFLWTFGRIAFFTVIVVGRDTFFASIGKCAHFEKMAHLAIKTSALPMSSS